MSEDNDVIGKIDSVLKDYGCSTYIVIIRDPDSHMMIQKQEGDHIWLIGALKLVIKQIITSILRMNKLI